MMSKRGNNFIHDAIPRRHCEHSRPSARAQREDCGATVEQRDKAQCRHPGGTLERCRKVNFDQLPLGIALQRGMLSEERHFQNPFTSPI